MTNINTNIRWAKLAILDKRLKSFRQGYRQNICILGDDHFEISYLLKDYFEQTQGSDLIRIHVSAAHTNPNDFFKSIAFSILCEHSGRIDTLDNLIKTENELTNTIDFLKQTLKKEKISFEDITTLLSKFLLESQKQCLLIIEEFINLKRLFAGCAKDFAKFIILQRNCMIILTAVDTLDTEKYLSTELNLLFGNFEKIQINFSSFIDKYLYLKTTLNPYPASPFFISFLLNLLGTNSIYYAKIGQYLKTDQSTKTETDLLVDLLSQLVFWPNTYLYQKFINQIETLSAQTKDSTKTIKLLNAIACGYCRKNELASLNIFDQKTLPTQLTKLIQLNLLANYGNIYKLKDPLFAFWLTNVFCLTNAFAIADQNKRYQLFTQKVREELEIFKTDFMKDKIKKVNELLASFQNDSLAFGNFKYKLPAIRKSKIIRYPEQDLSLLVAEGKEIILAGIKENPTEDSDLLNFITESGNVKGKKVRKLFICLNRISQTAKLIAKNNKIALWDLNDINQLMQVYRKSLISLEDIAKVEVSHK